MTSHRRSPHRTRVLLLAVAIACIGTARSHAQQVVGPTFQLGMVEASGLARGFDGDVVVMAMPMDGQATRVLRYDNGAPPLSSSTSLIGDYRVFAQAAPLARGGYVAAWGEGIQGAFFEFDVNVHRLDPDAKLLGLPTPAAQNQILAARAGVAPIGDGFVVAWPTTTLYLRRFDGSGSAVGPAFDVGIADPISDVVMRAVPGGGVVVVWGADGGTRARVFDADLVPLGPVLEVANTFKMVDLTVSPDGAVAAIAGRTLGGGSQPNELRLRFFRLDGSSLGSDVIVRTLPAGQVVSEPAIAFGAGGDLLFVWGERTSGFDGLFGRLYDATGAPTAPPQVLTGGQSPTGFVRMVRRADDKFFLVWTDFGRSNGAIVSICAPQTSVCGDGTLTSTCEVCDDGAGNSDETPDACRSDCHPARCGDGVIDAGEACDDGNLTACDGCNPFCEVEHGTVCGDGVLAPQGCREACDDDNAVAGDGCSPACFVEHIPGGGSSSLDCYAAWRIDNPSNEPRYDKRGYIDGKQECRDNDSACDFDGGVAGSCTFHLAVCVNNSEPADCVPARLQSWTLRTPSEKQAEKSPALAAARVGLASTVLPSVVGSSDPDFCSPNVDLVVPLRGSPGRYRSGTLKLKSVATVYSGATDTDGLSLRCDP